MSPWTNPQTVFGEPSWEGIAASYPDSMVFRLSPSERLPNTASKTCSLVAAMTLDWADLIMDCSSNKFHWNLLPNCAVATVGC